jgi:hypothetical protein
VGDPLGLWEVRSTVFPAGCEHPVWRAEAEFGAACAGQGVGEGAADEAGEVVVVPGDG